MPPRSGPVREDCAHVHRDRTVGVAGAWPGARFVAALAMLVAAGSALADEPARVGPPKTGVLVNDPRAQDGYTLIFPMPSTRTYLIDMQGRVARMWQSKYAPGQEAYLLENGHLLRPAKMADSEALSAGAGGGGRIQEFDEKGKVVRDFKFHNEKQIQHHAVTRMPNGHIMMLVWERKSPEECIAAGVKPENAGRTDILVDALIEVQPAGKTGGKIVWEWHLRDHLIQDRDRTKPNYGDVAAHPELIDANFKRDVIAAVSRRAAEASSRIAADPKAGAKKAEEKGNDAAFDRLKTIGYVGAGGAGSRKLEGYFPDWNHINSVCDDAKLDQLVNSSRQFSEIYIIDHGTTSAEAKGHTGGGYGKGGDILYRWGNPRAYRAGTEADQRLFHQHDAQWIPDGLPGAGPILIYSNGDGRPDGTNYSSVDGIVTPVTADGRHERPPGKPFDPDQPVWTFATPNKEDLFSPIICGTQRLANGNALLADGFLGSIWEVTPSKEVVWKYIVPRDMKPGTEIRPGGAGIAETPSPPACERRPLQALPDSVAMWLWLSPDQKKSAAELEAHGALAVEAMLTPGQRDRLKDLAKPGGPTGFRLEPEPAEILTPDVVGRLELSGEQEQRLESLRKETSARILAILSGQQRRWYNTSVATRRSFIGGSEGRPAGQRHLPRLPVRRGLPRAVPPRPRAGPDHRGAGEAGEGPVGHRGARPLRVGRPGNTIHDRCPGDMSIEEGSADESAVQDPEAS